MVFLFFINQKLIYNYFVFMFLFASILYHFVWFFYLIKISFIIIFLYVYLLRFILCYKSIFYFDYNKTAYVFL
ncbi:Hypothetical Protein SLY_0102 [Strawberry lethal yellows phytoplasma (CPA) str. NZSb11]|uniref:Uncharacterized protein n=1 Tax=Strawberry lethal yellows phytoplasma (CPA) str. NZSb11 TaxID=980422 RepID=R4RZX9_PHYAS|nr:Hypothetical Protein SLY_0102 [Strawberry lethal yellows phytoplasma (CPA) str. NZSb11]